MATVKTLKRARITKPRIAEIPEQRYFDEYVGRKINGKTEFEIFDYANDNSFNVLIEGPTGPGKTSAALAYAAARKRHFYAVPSNVAIDPRQLFGGIIPDEENAGVFVWQDGPVTDIARNGGVILINEVNFMPPRIATVLFSLLDKRRSIALLDHKGEVIKVHRGNGQCWCDLEDCDDLRVLVIADMNPDYAGTQQVNAAFRNRFPIQLDWGYDDNVEAQLVKSDHLRVLARKFRAQQVSGEFVTPVSTNMLQEFERLVRGLGLEFAIENFTNHFAVAERPSVAAVFRASHANLLADYTASKGNDDEYDDEDDDDWDIINEDLQKILNDN